MNKELLTLCKQLTDDIQSAYESGTTLDSAEKLAAKFLYGQIQVSEELKTADLDARMRKNGVKAIRAAVYLENATKTEKKPSDVMLEAQVNLNDIVSSEQLAFDTAETYRNSLENYLGIFKDAHIFFRGVSKGRFE